MRKDATLEETETPSDEEVPSNGQVNAEIATGEAQKEEI